MRERLLNRTARWWLLGAAAAACSACNGLFYYPDPQEHMRPDRFDIAFDSVMIPAHDGTKLHAWVLHSDTTPAVATVLHFHGNAENISTHFLAFSWLVEEGFDVVIFDYRGYGESEGKPTRAGLIDDGTTMIDWVRRHPTLGNKDLFIAAQSLGGAVAVPSLAIAGTARVRGIVLDSTFNSYRQIARDKLAGIWITWPLQWPLGFLVSDDFSPVDYIAQLKVPVLFVHGQADPAVPYALGQRLYDAANEPKEFWSVPVPGHTVAFATKDGRYRRALVSFFRKMLTPTAKPAR